MHLSLMLPPLAHPPLHTQGPLLTLVPVRFQCCASVPECDQWLLKFFVRKTHIVSHLCFSSSCEDRVGLLLIK